MQLTDKDGNIFGTGGLEITTSTGKPKIPVINTDITIGTTAIVGGVSGRLLFDDAGVVGETGGINWNPTTSTLSLLDSPFYSQAGNSSANTGFSITGTASSNYTIYSSRQFIFNTGQSMYFNTDTDGGSALDRAWYFAGARSGLTGGRTYGALTVDSSGFPSFTLYNNDNGARILLASNATSYFNGGNLLVGTTTDAGFKFDVIGSTRVTSLKTADIFPASASISLWTNSLNASSRFYTAPVHQDGRINFNAIAGGSDQVLIRAWHTGSFGLGTGSSATNAALTVRGDTLLVGPSGALYFMNGTFGPNNVPYRLAISTTATTTSFYSGVGNNLTNIESTKFEYTATSHTFYTGTTAGNQANPNQYTPLHLSNLGNVTIGSTIDAGFRLDVAGTGRFQGGIIVSNPSFTGQGSIAQAGNNTTVITGRVAGASENITFGPSNRIFINAGQSRFPSGSVQIGSTLTVGNSGNASTVNMLYVTGGISASFAIARGQFIDTALTASANNDILVGLEIQPTFTNGAFTGISNIGFRLTQSGSTNNIFRMSSSSGSANIIQFFNLNGETFQGGIVATNTVFNYGTYATNQVNISGGTGGVAIRTNNSAPIRFYATNVDGDFSTVQMQMFGATGNLLLQNGGTYTDAGYKLDVNGTIRAKSDTYIGYENIAAGSTYIQINPDKFNSKIIFNDFDGGTGTRGGILEMSTYKSRLTYGSYNWFYIGDSINPFMFYIAPSTGNFVLTRQNTQPTDSGYKLDVGGTAIIRGDLSTASGKNMLFGTTLPSRQTNSAQYPAIFVGNSNSGIFGETTTGYKGINLNANIVRDTSLYWVLQDTTQPGWIVGLNYETGFTDAFSINRSPATTGTAAISTLFQVKGNGNILIGTTTDAGYKLNVNGTGYFGSNLRVNGTITAATPTANTYVCHIGLTTDQVLASGADALLDFVDVADTNNWYDPTTKKFLPNVAGYYHIDFSLWFEPSPVSTGQYNIQVRKNGTTVMIIQQPTINNGTGQSLMSSKLVYFNGTTDYIDFTAYQSTGSNRNIWKGTDSSGTYATIHLLAV